MKTETSYQNCLDTLCEELQKQENRTIDFEAHFAGEDSSYDSDFEGSEDQLQHDDVSRTVSDTLGAEFSEYVSLSASQQSDSGYTSRLEFALKLGYTERLVQAALQKLGPNPEQNELLAELIKLGAQSGSKLKYDSDGYEDSTEYVLPAECSYAPPTEGAKIRPIVIDGSNVAMSHGNKEVFSCRGIRICVDWFRARGHSEITVFVPKWRKESPRPDNLVIDQEILYELERERLLVFTPSREVRGKRMVCYDDRYILKLAAENDGIVVSNDNYRDLIQECPEYRKVVEERILMYSFVNDRFMPPDDPLGRAGPMLDNFLRIYPQKKADNCPYGKKCTYGNKCKYNHPERGCLPHKTVTERLVEHAQKQLQARNQDYSFGKQLKGKSLSLPLQSSTSDEQAVKSILKKTPLSRTKSSTVASGTEPTEFDKTKCEKVESMTREACFRGAAPIIFPQSTMWPPNQMHTQWNNPVLPFNHSMIYQDHPNRLKNHPEPDSRNQEFVPPVCDATNLHRKLQRQLSINPISDSRIYQMQKFQNPNNTHQNLSRHYSHQNSDGYSLMPPQHSNVTRIASAPSSNSHYTLPNTLNMASASDSQINISVPSVNLPPYTPNWNTSPVTSTNYPFTAKDESRHKLRYHLASIFPEEQVDTVLQLYPNETNPQKICAAILSMFPTRS